MVIGDGTGSSSGSGLGALSKGLPEILLSATFGNKAFLEHLKNEMQLWDISEGGAFSFTSQHIRVRLGNHI